MSSASLCFILGAKDLEMDTIESVLKSSGALFGYAGVVRGDNGQTVRVGPNNAYRAETIIGVDAIAHHRLVFVECDFERCDHHRVIDAGYGKSPEEFLEASSIGQVIRMLVRNGIEVPVTGRIRAVAAADHCLPAAYQGECPGVSPEQVLEVRLPELCLRHGMPEADVRAGIDAARALLASAPFVEIGAGNPVRDLRHYGVQPFVLEAATMAGAHFLGHVDTRDPKKIMLSAFVETVQCFLNGWAQHSGISGLYGDPGRGFAGGSVA